VPAELAEIVIESDDPVAAATFWSAALGWPLHTYEPGAIPWVSASGEATGADLKLVFVPVGPGRPASTRLYLRPDQPLDDAVAHLQALGARRPDDERRQPWVPLVDPGGTGFTVLAPPPA
jgi:hypothetical protein